MKDFQMNLWLKSEVTSILWPEKGLNLVSFFSSVNHFIYFFTLLGLGCCEGFSLVVANEGSSSLQGQGFSWWCLLFLGSKGSRHSGSAGPRAQTQGWWPAGLLAPGHVGSSQTRN